MNSELHLSVRFALLQVVTIVVGVFLTAIVLKACGYPENDLRWNLLPVLIRDHGFALLLLPLIWTGWVIYMEQSSQLWWSRRWTVVSAVMLMVMLVAVFFSAATNPYRGRMIVPTKQTR